MLVLMAIAGCETTGHAVRESGGSDNIATLEALKQPASGGVKVQAEANAAGKYHVGDPIKFRISGDKPGKLWVVMVNSENHAELLFPRDENDENTVDAGHEYQFPPRDSKQTLYADKPLGKTLLAFVVTGKGVELNDIISLKNGNLRNISFGSENQWGVAKLTIHVEK